MDLQSDLLSLELIGFTLDTLGGVFRVDEGSISDV